MPEFIAYAVLGVLVVVVLVLIDRTARRAITTYAHHQQKKREQIAFFQGIATEHLNYARDTAKALQRVAIAAESIADNRPIVKERDEAKESIAALVLGVNDVLDAKTPTVPGEQPVHEAGRILGEQNVRDQLTKALQSALSTEH